MEINCSQKNSTARLNELSASKKAWTAPDIELISNSAIATGTNPTFNEGVLRGQGYSAGITQNFVS